MRQSVSLPIAVSRTIGKGEIKPGKEQSPAGLSRVEPHRGTGDSCDL